VSDDSAFTVSIAATSGFQMGDRIEICNLPCCGTISFRIVRGLRTVASISMYEFWQNPKSYLAWRCRRIKTWFIRRILRRKDYGYYIVTSSMLDGHGLASEVKMRPADAEVRI
jgi:hypothetical protein